MNHLIFLLSAFTALAPSLQAVAADGIPEERRHLMAIGASLGDARLEVLAWSSAGETKRLRVIGLDEGTAKGKLGGYVVIDDKALNRAQINTLRQILLDPAAYEHPDIRRPVSQEEGIGYVAGRLCGGFRPFLAVRLTDAEGRFEDVFICLTCDEVEFAPVTTPANDHRDAEDRRPLGPPPKGAVRKYLSSIGALRLAEFASDLYPRDKAIAWQRDKRRKSPTTEGRPTGR